MFERRHRLSPPGALEVGGRNGEEEMRMSVPIPTLAELKQAYATTSQVTRVTPLVEAPAFAADLGASQVFVKAESLQLTGSFKLRGAYYRLTRLDADEAARGVIAYSSGNFAQGLAAAGALLGIPVTIVMPIDAPLAKRDATKAYGARVIVTEHGDRPREEVALARARELATEQGLTLLHPFDDPDVIAGQAGVALEALAQLSERGTSLDMAFCPVGGGGLVAGVSLALHHLSPQTRIHGVEMEGFDGMGTSLAGGEIVTVPLVRRSICDGLMARRPGVHPFAAVEPLGLVPMTMPDAAVRRAMRAAFEKLKLVFEPSGAAALAALLEGGVDVSGKTVLVVASGGNVSVDDFFRHCGDV
jgi:threonine dehydratase